MDGFNGFPNRLMEINYVQNDNYPNSISVWFMKSTMSAPQILFQENQWYKELFAKCSRYKVIEIIH